MNAVSQGEFANVFLNADIYRFDVNQTSQSIHENF
jgi:hypothetical protein